MKGFAVFILFLVLLAIPTKADSIYCIDNNTMHIPDERICVDNTCYNITEDYGTGINNYTCDWGCDNNTLSCNPPEYQQNVINYGIFFGIIVFFILVYAWARRKH